MNKRTACEIVKGLNTQVDNRSMPLDVSALKARREKLGLNQRDFAKRAKMSQPAYARIESGARPDPALSTAERIARAMGCRVDDLIVKRRR